jgi:hypothetical protein
MKPFREPLKYEDVVPGIDLLITEFEFNKKRDLIAQVQCWNGTILHEDPICFGKSKDRSRFAQKVEKVAPGVLIKLEAALLKIGPGLREIIRTQFPDSETVEKSEQSSTAARFVRMLKKSDTEFFCGEDDEKAYATVTVGEHRETFRMQSKDFKHWLSRNFFDLEQKTLSAQSMQEVLLTLEGTARFEGQKRPVHLRLAAVEDCIYWDLVDATWRQIKISKDGWTVIESKDSPVRFRRGRGMRALPLPEPGGDLPRLRRLVNLPDERALILYIGWCVGALRADANAFPVLCLIGEQGAAKSTAALFARMLIDPNAAPLRAHPRDERDLAITAQASHVVAFDNLSTLKQAESDALCRLSTGGGLSTRALYTDDEETIFSAVRPIVITAIPEIFASADLVDRAIILELPPVPDEERISDKDMRAAFDLEYPRFIGALCDAVSLGLRNVGQVEIPGLPRMADFAKWVIASESRFTAEGAFLEAYRDNREKATELSVRASEIATVINQWLVDDSVTITLKLLLKEIDKVYETENRPADPKRKVQKPAGWPATPKALGNELRRCAPILRRIGIQVADAGLHPDDRSAMRRFTRLDKPVFYPSEPSEPSEAREAKANQGVTSEGSTEGCPKVERGDVNSANIPNIPKVPKVPKGKKRVYRDPPLKKNGQTWPGDDPFSDLGPESLPENNWGGA